MSDAQWVTVALALIGASIPLSLVATMIRNKRRGRTTASRHAVDGVTTDQIVDVERSRAANRY